MSHPTEYNEEYLHSVIDSVMEGEKVIDESTPVEEITKSFHLPLGETRIFSLVWQEFSQKIGNASTWEIIEPIIETVTQEVQSQTIQTVHTAVKNCRRCPNVLQGPYLPVGNWQDPDVLVVWSIPPAKGALHETSFLELLTQAGFKKERILYTSIVRCDTQSKDTPTHLEVNNCIDYLAAEMQLLTPRITLLQGAKVTNALLPSVKHTESCGKVFWMGPYPLMPIQSFGQAKFEDKMDKLVTDLTSAWHFCYDK